MTRPKPTKPPLVWDVTGEGAVTSSGIEYGIFSEQVRGEPRVWWANWQNTHTGSFKTWHSTDSQEYRSRHAAQRAAERHWQAHVPGTRATPDRSHLRKPR